MSRLFPALMASIVLCSCTLVEVEDANGSRVDLEVEWVDEEPEPEPENPPASTGETAAFFNDQLDEQALRQSYEDAATVREIMTQVALDLQPAARDALTPALQAFSDDVDTLKYFAEIIEYEDLTDAEVQTVLEIMTDIEAAMTVFGEILEMTL